MRVVGKTEMDVPSKSTVATFVIRLFLGASMDVLPVATKPKMLLPQLLQLCSYRCCELAHQCNLHVGVQETQAGTARNVRAVGQ